MLVAFLTFPNATLHSSTSSSSSRRCWKPSSQISYPLLSARLHAVRRRLNRSRLLPFALHHDADTTEWWWRCCHLVVTYVPVVTQQDAERHLGIMRMIGVIHMQQHHLIYIHTMWENGWSLHCWMSYYATMEWTMKKADPPLKTRYHSYGSNGRNFLSEASAMSSYELHSTKSMHVQALQNWKTNFIRISSLLESRSYLHTHCFAGLESE